MLAKLDNTNKALAKHIYTTFQRSYKIEAELIGALNFPPLPRQLLIYKIRKRFFMDLLIREPLSL